MGSQKENAGEGTFRPTNYCRQFEPSNPLRDRITYVLQLKSCAFGQALLPRLKQPNLAGARNVTVFTFLHRNTMVFRISGVYILVGKSKTGLSFINLLFAGMCIAHFWFVDKKVMVFTNCKRPFINHRRQTSYAHTFLQSLYISNLNIPLIKYSPTRFSLNLRSN